ncbi:MAG: cell division protein ZapD [Gammaproteobacteria bacterium]|nr:cell division protein ZapD [Gammaproteobacteria bacterium]
MACFEYPLNERSRILLRLEYIFARILHYLPSEVSWDSQAAIAGLVEAANLFSRTDLKSELLKEIDRNLNGMKRLNQLPGVDPQRLQETLDSLTQVQTSLLQHSKQIGLDLREDDFFKAIMQRSTIPGGTCAFDLPLFHLWLSKPKALRIQTLSRWFDEFSAVNDSVKLLLGIYRGSYVMSEAVAAEGYYQQGFDAGQTTQLVSVELPSDCDIFPEVSGNRHRMSIRFRKVDSTTLEISTHVEDLSFRLGLSVI